MYINIEGKPEWNIPKVGKKKIIRLASRIICFLLKKKKSEKHGIDLVHLVCMIVLL